MASSCNRRVLMRRVLCVAFWTLGLGLSGCQVVLGEYQAGHGTAGSAGAAHTGGAAVAGGGTSAGATQSSGGAESTAGAGAVDCSGTDPYRCQDAALQACTAGVWTTIDTCTRPALCQPALGVCDVCADGERTCTGSVLGVCSADHTAFTPAATCVDPLYCDVTADHCVACGAGWARCNGDFLDVCNAARTAWNLQAQSCSGLGCFAVGGKADYCNDCTAANPSVCVSSSTLLSCVSGKWRATACPTGCADATTTTPAACY
jgi:hypothetical protein